MATYNDATGYTWAVNLDVKVLKEIRKRVTDSNDQRVDLLDVQNGQAIVKIMGDPILLTDILWVICEKQAAKDGITQDGFYANHRGDVFLHAIDALVEAVSNFFPSLEGLAYREIFRTAKKAREEQGEKLKAALAPKQSTVDSTEKVEIQKKTAKKVKKESTAETKSGS